MQINSDKQLAQLGGKKNRLPTVEGKIVRWDQWGQSERRDTLQPAEQNSAVLFFSFLSFSFFFLPLPIFPSVQQIKLSSWPWCTLQRAEMMAFCRYESPRAKKPCLSRMHTNRGCVSIPLQCTLEDSRHVVTHCSLRATARNYIPITWRSGNHHPHDRSYYMRVSEQLTLLAYRCSIGVKLWKNTAHVKKI